MKTSFLRVFFYPDVPAFERASFEALLLRLQEEVALSVTEVNANHENILSSMKEDHAWIIARKWRHALSFLGASQFKRGTVFISALDLDSPRKMIFHLLVKHLWGSLPKSCLLLVHSPINYRFFAEMEKHPDRQLRYLPLPLGGSVLNRERKTEKPVTLGTFTVFTSEAQLNFIASVAHYVLKQNPTLKFRVLGSGPLYHHMIDLGSELELGSRFCVSDCLGSESISDLDALIYCPLRNDHFIPLYVSAQYAVPVVATEMSGIEEFIENGKTGFIFPVNETKPLSECLLRLATSAELRDEIGKKFQHHVFEHFSMESVFSTFLELFTGQRVTQNISERAA